MNILKLTDQPAELEAVKDMVMEELQYLRSLDTAGDGGRRVARGYHKVQINPGLMSLASLLCFQTST